MQSPENFTLAFGQAEISSGEFTRGFLSHRSQRPEASIFQRLKHWLFGSVIPMVRCINSAGEVFPANCATNRVNNRKYSFFTLVPMFIYNILKDWINAYFFSVLIFAAIFDPNSSCLKRVFLGKFMCYFLLGSL